MSEKQISGGRQSLAKKNEEITSRQQLFTDKEASDYLRISQVTLWRERKAGKIAFHRVAGQIRYTQNGLDEYLQRNKREAFACAV